MDERGFVRGLERSTKIWLGERDHNKYSLHKISAHMYLKTKHREKATLVFAEAFSLCPKQMLHVALSSQQKRPAASCSYRDTGELH